MAFPYSTPVLNRPCDITDGTSGGFLYYDEVLDKIRLLGSDDFNQKLFANTYWDDYQLELLAGKQGALGKPDFDYTNIGYLFPKNDATEILYLRGQMPHRWKMGSKVYPHVHWTQTVNENPVFKIDYKIYNVGTEIGADWQTYSMSTQVFSYTGNSFAQITTSNVGIDLTGIELSAILKFKLYRDDNVYTGDALVDSFDMHIEIDSFGSEEEYDKYAV